MIRLVVLKREWNKIFWHTVINDSIRNKNEKALSEKSDEIEESFTKHDVNDNYGS